MKKQRFVSVPAAERRQCHQSVISAALLALLAAGCTVPKPPEPLPDWIVEGVDSGSSVTLWNQTEKEGGRYKINLACISEVRGQESREVLLNNLQSSSDISVVLAREPKYDENQGLYNSTAEVFVNLGDGPQSVNEAQLLAGVATLRKDANPQNCPRLDAMKQAQQEAKDSKAGVWAKRSTD